MGKGLSKFDFLNVDELERKIQELRKNALRRIDESNKKHVQGGDSCIHNDEGLQLFLHQIKNKMLLVAVVGEGSCGKSTLINAFLRDKILPSGIGKVTGFRIFIGHDPKVHKDPCKSGNCDECPYLVRGIQKHDILCHGVKNIKARITEKNQELDDENRNEPLVLYTYIPVFDSLSSSSHCTPYFVDSPGVEVINDDVKSYYSILSAMIYVENYQRLLQNEENIKKELGCKPENASLFFAVSHFDKYYTSSEDEQNPNEEGTKAKVECDIELVNHEEVFPVCGLWALHAHLTLRYQERDQISHVVEEAYNWIPKSKIFDRISNKASCILNISAFKELEKKLKRSINATNFQQWNILMYRQCLEFLEGRIQVGDCVLHIIESKIFDSLKNIEEIKVKIDCLKNLEEGVQKYVLEELEENISHILFSFSRRVSPKIKEGMRTFRSSCIDSVNNNYTFGQYLEDWDVFSKQDLSDLIKQELDDETKRCIEALECKLREKYNMLVRHILGHDPQSITFMVEAEIQEVDSHSVGEPSKSIKGFVSDRTKDKKWWNYFRGLISAGVGVVVGTGAGFSGYLAVMALPAVVAVVPAIISSGAIIAGLSGATYFVMKGLKIKDQNMKLRIMLVKKKLKNYVTD
ncbi:PREDICTED: uncharacterized protein LOC109584676 isoform X2 [Amphimedon queenslandica]|uniref:Dynamin N-terminal domain-containing protein n=1 Tax=Amphimedon queenslandica TaxID=400682 RepID=A0AAN0JHB5_AMPQE|nr:PREDICTED: uncharacterized protein LOC109584676 isoform X2 [Amphimedon queenslandica]|eukprot:XP_019856053.1 PREDICTED: uncharacterized protein LOC109584676 isoform X2 [Amphimedon queenslandica]